MHLTHPTPLRLRAAAAALACLVLAGCTPPGGPPALLRTGKPRLLPGRRRREPAPPASPLRSARAATIPIWTPTPSPNRWPGCCLKSWRSSPPGCSWRCGWPIPSPPVGSRSPSSCGRGAPLPTARPSPPRMWRPACWRPRPAPFTAGVLANMADAQTVGSDTVVLTPGPARQPVRLPAGPAHPEGCRDGFPAAHPQRPVHLWPPGRHSDPATTGPPSPRKVPTPSG